MLHLEQHLGGTSVDIQATWIDGDGVVRTPGSIYARIRPSNSIWGSVCVLQNHGVPDAQCCLLVGTHASSTPLHSNLFGEIVQFKREPAMERCTE